MHSFQQKIKRTFLSSEPLPIDFSKIQFYGNQIRHGTSNYVQFHDRWLNSVGREKSQRNHRSELIRTLPRQWQSVNAQNWKMGGDRFKPRSHLSTQPFGVFRGFLRNSRKHGLGSLRKTPHGGHFSYRTRSLVRQSAFVPTTNQRFLLL